MSKVKQLIFFKDIGNVSEEEILIKLGFKNFEYIGESNLCETNKTANFFLGRINGGVLLMGGDFYYSLFWDEDSEIRKCLLENFATDEIISIVFNDQVMHFGYLLIKNGELIRIKEEGDIPLTFGERTEFENELRAQILHRELAKWKEDGKLESEIEENLESITTYEAVEEFEKKYLGIYLIDLKCQEFKMKQFLVQDN